MEQRATKRRISIAIRKLLLQIREHPWLAVGIAVDLLVIGVVGTVAVFQLLQQESNPTTLTVIAAAFTALLTLLFGMERENQSAQDKALQEYLDRISELETYKDLRKATEDGYKRAVMRAKMRTLVWRLDSRRKGVLLRFLHEAKLIKKKEYLRKGRSEQHVRAKRSEKHEGKKDAKKKKPWYYPILSLESIDLSGADLSHSIELVADDLSGVNLSNADLSGARLQGVNFRKADLSDANLRNAKLCEADSKTVSELDKRVGPPTELFKLDLTEADLTGADLTGADLTRADLTGADLTGANLTGADLREAKGLTQTQIEKAIGDESTRLPKGLSLPISEEPASGQATVRVR